MHCNYGDDGGDDNCFYLSAQQYQRKKGSCQLLPQPHGCVAPFSSFLSLTRVLLFPDIEAPVHEELSLSRWNLKLTSFLLLRPSSYPPVTTICSDNRTALRPLIALGKLYATPSKACTMRVLLMQNMKIRLDVMIVDSLGQAFIQLINISQGKFDYDRTRVWQNSVDDMNGRSINFTTYKVCKYIMLCT